MRDGAVPFRAMSGAGGQLDPPGLENRAVPANQYDALNVLYVRRGLTVVHRLRKKLRSQDESLLFQQRNRGPCQSASS